MAGDGDKFIADSAAGESAEGLRARLHALVFDASVTAPDVEFLLGGVCRAAVHDLGFDGASVSLAGTAAGTSADIEVVAAASDEPARALHELELGLGEGPGREAMALGRPVLTRDLLREGSRWPAYAAAALEAGVRSVFVFPVGVGASRLGVYTVHRGTVGSLTHRDVAEQLALARLATEILLDVQPPGASDGAQPGFIDGLDVADEIFQAQGMVSVQLGITLPEALSALRAHAYAEGRRLRDLSADVVEGRALLPEYFRHWSAGEDNDQ